MGKEHPSQVVLYRAFSSKSSPQSSPLRTPPSEKRGESRVNPAARRALFCASEAAGSVAEVIQRAEFTPVENANLVRDLGRPALAGEQLRRRDIHTMFQTTTKLAKLELDTPDWVEVDWQSIAWARSKSPEVYKELLARRPLKLGDVLGESHLMANLVTGRILNEYPDQPVALRWSGSVFSGFSCALVLPKAEPGGAEPEDFEAAFNLKWSLIEGAELEEVFEEYLAVEYGHRGLHITTRKDGG